MSKYFPPFESTKPAEPDPAPDDPWMTVSEVATQMRVSKMTVYRAANGGFLHAIRAGRSVRIRRSWFEAWVRDGAPTYEQAAS